MPCSANSSAKPRPCLNPPLPPPPFLDQHLWHAASRAPVTPDLAAQFFLYYHLVTALERHSAKMLRQLFPAAARTELPHAAGLAASHIVARLSPQTRYEWVCRCCWASRVFSDTRFFHQVEYTLTALGELERARRKTG